MSQVELSVEVDNWLERYMAFLSGEVSSAPRLEELEPTHRQEAEHLVRLLSEIWGREATSGHRSDNVAQRLGFLARPSDARFDGKSLAQARKAAGLTVSELAAQVTNMGHPIRGREIGKIESGQPSKSAAQLIPLFTAALRIDASQIATFDLVEEPTFIGPAVRSVIKRTAQKHNQNVGTIIDYLKPRFASAAYRKTEMTSDEEAEIAEILLRDYKP